MDFRYRLLGQQLIDGFGLNLAGKLHSQHAPGSNLARPIYTSYVRCVASAAPQDIDGRIRNHNGTLADIRGRVWPLSEDGVTVTGLLAAGKIQAPKLD